MADEAFIEQAALDKLAKQQTNNSEMKWLIRAKIGVKLISTMAFLF